MKKKELTNEVLDLLIKTLEDCAKRNIYDPWVIEDANGVYTVEPLDALLELRIRRRINP